MSEKLNPTKALIFRITHRANVAWIFKHGMYCRNSSQQDPEYRAIGNPELIAKRAYRDVPIHPYGTLSDYIPFYFTPFTPMMRNIQTGWGGITKVTNEDVVIFVSSIHRLASQARTFVSQTAMLTWLGLNSTTILIDLIRLIGKSCKIEISNVIMMTLVSLSVIRQKRLYMTTCH